LTPVQKSDVLFKLENNERKKYELKISTEAAAAAYQ